MGAFTSSGMFNPSAGAGMPGFQEGYQDGGQDQFTTQSDMFTQSLPGYQLNTNTVFPGNQQQPMTQGDGQLPPGFGALSPIDRSQINPSASIGMTGGGFGGGKQSGQDQILGFGGNIARSLIGATLGKALADRANQTNLPTQSPTPLMGGMGSLVTQPAPGQLPPGFAQISGRTEYVDPSIFDANGRLKGAPAPGQNPSVSMGMPIQQPNRFIPPNAPGASARRPTPGIPFPGQTGLTRPRVAPQPMPINRFTRGRFR